MAAAEAVPSTRGVKVQVPPPTRNDQGNALVIAVFGGGRVSVAYVYADFVAGFARITSDPDRMGGVPCIRGLRFPVATVVAMVADGMSDDEILSEHPDLEPEDIREALRFAAAAVQERQLPLRLPA